VVIGTEMAVIVSSGELGVAARLLEAACLSRMAPLTMCRVQRPCARLCRCAVPRIFRAKIWALERCHCSQVRCRRLAPYMYENRPNAIMPITSRSAMNCGGHSCSWLRERALRRDWSSRRCISRSSDHYDVETPWQQLTDPMQWTALYTFRPIQKLRLADLGNMSVRAVYDKRI
jgi:hypothetical protein